LAPDTNTNAFRRLLHLYGSAYAQVLKYMDEGAALGWSKETVCRAAQPAGARGADRFVRAKGGAPSYVSALTAAEVLHSVREEMAQKLSDVVFRRTSLGLTGDREDGALRTGAAVMSRELGWDDLRTQREISEVKSAFAVRA
jgi:glycerol-3-phosphate dehydrogenase